MGTTTLERRLVSTQEAAMLLGCSTRSVLRFVKAGMIEPVVLRERGKLRFELDAVEALIDRSRRAAS